MQLACFDGGNGSELGVVLGEDIAPLSRSAQPLALDMIDLIDRWSLLQSEIRLLLSQSPARLRVSAVRLLAPIARPGKIMAISLNYADHIAESGMKNPERQLWFSKGSNTVHGPNDPVELPRVSSQVDYEVEMVVVIGKGGRHISREHALDAVFGYCVGNDVSARDWQLSTPQWTLGKSFDTHGPFGPWITTADQVDDPHNIGIRCFVNGEMRQNSNTRHLVFNVAEQIAHLSKVMTLNPGDLVFTGTPGGVGVATKTFLQAGDRVRCEADHLGAIENAFQPER